MLVQEHLLQTNKDDAPVFPHNAIPIVIEVCVVLAGICCV